MVSSGLNLCIGWDFIQIHYLFKYYLKKIGGQHANCEYISPFGGKVVGAVLINSSSTTPCPFNLVFVFQR